MELDGSQNDCGNGHLFTILDNRICRMYKCWSNVVAVSAMHMHTFTGRWNGHCQRTECHRREDIILRWHRSSTSYGVLSIAQLFFRNNAMYVLSEYTSGKFVLSTTSVLCKSSVPGDYWGGIENGTGDGQIGAVYDHQVDFAIGCIYKWYSDVFDMTQSVAKSAVTLLVPEALCVLYCKYLPFLTNLINNATSQAIIVRIDANITVCTVHLDVSFRNDEHFGCVVLCGENVQ